MNEFMLFIKALGNPIGNLSKEKQEHHVQKVSGFIQQLVSESKLKNAQPLEPHGVIISNDNGNLTELKVNDKEEMISGYYHIQAKDLDQAIEIAKSDPRFEDGKWRMEIRRIMKIDGINK